MQLSIFPKAKAHPSSKAEKAQHSKFASTPNKPTTVEFESEEDLIELITNNAWSPATFSQYRRLKDFVSTDLIAFDIDDGMSIGEAEKVVEKLGLCALCMPSPSHTPEDHRFRLVFPLARTITDVEIFKATYAELAENFPVDPQCKDACRFYFGCTMDDGFWIDGELYEPVEPEIEPESVFDREAYRDSIEVLEDVQDVVRALYGEDKTKIPEQVDYFIRNAGSGLPGEWWTSSNSFLFTLGLQKIPFEKVAAVYEELAPEPLDDNDEYLLHKSYQDGLDKSKEFEDEEKKSERRSRKSRRSRRVERRRRV